MNRRNAIKSVAGGVAGALVYAPDSDAAGLTSDHIELIAGGVGITRGETGEFETKVLGDAMGTYWQQMQAALTHLREMEWREDTIPFGHKQPTHCPACYRVKPGEQLPRGWSNEPFGHAPTCPLAKAIEELGGDVQWQK